MNLLRRTCRLMCTSVSRSFNSCYARYPQVVSDDAALIDCYPKEFFFSRVQVFYYTLSLQSKTLWKNAVFARFLDHYPKFQLF